MTVGRSPMTRGWGPRPDTWTAVGFTGTRKGMTPRQKAAFFRTLSALAPSSFHHGDCVGADDEAATYAMVMGGVETHSYPSTGRKNRAFTVGNTVEHPPAPPLERNVTIVKATTCLIACPDSMSERVRSGTWHTVRVARRHGRPILIVWPDGTVDWEGEWDG